ncbi:hypothetical protein F3I16_19815 [Pseudomonas sp. L-22-4S-12]|uniref:hypothetical protein n=1 Tax=Pseudomonas sp. L-22-4S-12 TaxID=2610893 RepID=UPI001324D153|nr:hypothetical protein [Pseudomonas sp. L-22-4S-12]MWV18291.1 hypothetical protein [Pseudomonas sp. L-22-4S-12]
MIRLYMLSVVLLGVGGCCNTAKLSGDAPLSEVVSVVNAATTKILALKQWDDFSAEQEHFESSCAAAKQGRVSACWETQELSYALCQSAKGGGGEVGSSLCGRIFSSDQTLCASDRKGGWMLNILDPKIFSEWCTSLRKDGECAVAKKGELVSCAAAEQVSGITLTKATLQAKTMQTINANGQVGLVVVNFGGSRSAESGQEVNLELGLRPTRTAYTNPETLSTWSPRIEAKELQDAIDKAGESNRLSKDEQEIQLSADDIVEYVTGVLNATLAKYSTDPSAQEGQKQIIPLRPRGFTVDINYNVTKKAEGGLKWDFTHTTGTAEAGVGVSKASGNVITLTFGPEP